jgi:hypothetical protein
MGGFQVNQSDYRVSPHTSSFLCGESLAHFGLSLSQAALIRSDGQWSIGKGFIVMMDEI